MRARIAALVWLPAAFGCPQEPQESTAAPTPVVAVQPTPSPPDAPTPADAGPTILVTPIGLSPLYEGFVRDPGAVATLSGRLGAVLETDVVTVEVVWDAARLRGAFTLLVPDAFAGGAPLADALAAGGPVDPAPLQPLLASLGAYRTELGDRFDVRLMSFDLRLGLWEPSMGTRCYAPGAAQDADGTTFAPCWTCVHPREGEGEVCFDGAPPAVVTGASPLLRMLESSLRPHRP